MSERRDGMDPTMLIKKEHAETLGLDIETLGLTETEQAVLTDTSHYMDLEKHTPEPLSQDTIETMRDQLYELRNRGYGPIVHVVSSPYTGQAAREGIPPEFHDPKLMQDLYIQREFGLPLFPEGNEPENVVHVNNDGSLTPEGEKLLDKYLIHGNPAGMIIGGGEGYPSDPMSTPILRAEEAALRSGAPTVGICLGHQHLLHLAGKEGLVGARDGGLVGAGHQIERLTEAGKAHRVFGEI
ncbi:hypothetical protein HN682_04070, partial [Candidatus Peregrinibacteria bacterium]|nr:hypothetical protein [Candidatus Peregrinibacteria bacterium]